MNSSSTGSGDPRGVASARSPFAFADTVQRLLAAFADRGLRVFATLDQQAAAAEVGLSMPPTTLIIFGNPKAGTPLMLAQPSTALDLPLKALVAESESGEVRVSFNTTAYIIERHDLPPALAGNLLPAERLIASVLDPRGRGDAADSH